MAQERPAVLVVGDPILDISVSGKATHIAPDAPVPVVRVEEEFARAGGMWNVAKNVAAAGATLCCAWIDEPPEHRHPLGDAVRDEVVACGECRPLILPRWRLQMKTRVFGQYERQMLRFDRPKNDVVSAPEAKAYREVFVRRWRSAERIDAILVCDYGCGTVGPGLVAALRHAFPEAPIIVDPYPTTPFAWYEGAHWIKLNEIEYACVVKARGGDRATPFAGCGWVVTHGPEPVAIIYPVDGKAKHAEAPTTVAPPKRRCVDPCGAGDVFAAYFAATLATGAAVYRAVDVANQAASLSVEQNGVVVVPRQAVGV